MRRAPARATAATGQLYGVRARARSVAAQAPVGSLPARRSALWLPHVVAARARRRLHDGRRGTAAVPARRRTDAQNVRARRPARSLALTSRGRRSGWDRCALDERSFSVRRASAEYRDLSGKLRELARTSSFPVPGEAYCGLRDHSIAEPPISIVVPDERVLRDRPKEWILVGLLTVIVCLPGLKTPLR